MMQLVLSLALGIVLFLVLYVLARRSPSVEGSAQAVLEARQALVALQGDLLPAETLTRIFDKRDFEYVVARAPLQIQELFLQERQRIAISWVDQIRKQISSLEGFHRGTARFYSRLSLRTELQLAGDFLMLSSICRMLQIAVRWGGPYAAPRMVGRTVTAAARVCDLSEKSLEFLRPSQFQPLRNRSVGNPTLL